MNNSEYDHIHQWRIDNDIDPYENSEEDENIPEDYTREFWIERLDDVFYKLNWMFRNGSHVCYRMITASENWKPNNKIGIYWSWDKNAADAHWGEYSNNNKKWLISANIKKENVDWPITVVYNTLRSYEDEKKIRILDDSKLEIISYEIVK